MSSNSVPSSPPNNADSARKEETVPFMANSSFVKRFSPMKKTIFSNDQEVFIDLPTPLILLRDNNAVAPFTPAGSTKALMGAPRGSYFKTIDPSSQSQSGSPSKKLDLTGMEDELDTQRTPKSQDKAGPMSLNNLKDSSVHEEVDIFANGKNEEYGWIQKKCQSFLDSKSWNTLITLFIIYALFANDIRILCFEGNVDSGFDVFTAITMAVFFLEIILTFISKKSYRWSLYFLIDLASTVSIVLDMTMVFSDVFPSGAPRAAQIARASRASRLGTKAGRAIKVVRLFRLVNLYKQVKDVPKPGDLAKVYPSGMVSSSSKMSEMERLNPFHMSRDSNEGTPVARMDHIEDGEREGGMSNLPVSTFSFKRQMTLDPVPMPFDTMKSRRKSFFSQAPKIESVWEDGIEDGLKESRVGQKLSDLSTKRVIVIVLSLMIFIPFFSADYFTSVSLSAPYEFTLLGQLIDDPLVSAATENASITYFVNQQKIARTRLVYLEFNETIWYQDPEVDVEDLRTTESNRMTVTTKDRGDIYYIVSTRPYYRLDAALNIGRTIFMVIVLAFGALLMSNDANNLVLRPIERMIEKVNRIAKNPLIAKEQRLVRDMNAGLENETVQIENAIIKIGGLLALGFGDAGAQIVAQNIAQSGDLNPMLPGKKMAAIFGFCDIRNFTDATEVLQEDVMVFVNSIADIVHSVVDKYTGAANKNIGDAFLLVWKFPDEYILQGDDGHMVVKNTRLVNNMSDFALISFLKIYAKINRDPTLLAYRQNPGLNARLPNYKVKMGFGLHIGWAIEGAIGSEFKVDASYLSPNVNLASRLEAATKQYGVPLLFSGDLYHKLSRPMQDKCRLIDVVTVKGSLLPIELYTCEMDAEDFIPSKNRDKIPIALKREAQRASKLATEQIMQYGHAASILEHDKELKHLWRFVDPIFNNMFKLGFDAYIQGDWATAKKRFEECQAMKNEDGPTKSLVGFLRENDYIAPEDWKGCHILTEK